MKHITTLRTLTNKRVYRSALFALFNKSSIGKCPPKHPLDTELHEYYRVLNEIVIPDCMQVASGLKGYSERMKKLMTHYDFACAACWNFGVELTYKMAAPADQMTRESLNKVRLLRAAIDLMLAMLSVMDDVADDSAMRMNRKSWHTICSGGKAAAMYDGAILGYFPFILLQKYFKTDPNYSLMTETFFQANTRSLVGLTLDVLNHQKVPTIDSYNSICYKAQPIFVLQATLGLIHAGILDENIIDQVSIIFERLGTLGQIWDDFREYFWNVGDPGKTMTDFHNGGTTWVSATAYSLFTPEQAEMFKECYGHTNPMKIKEAMKLLDEVDITMKYVDHMRNSYSSISQLIDSLPDVKLRNICYSYMNWLIGDVCDERSSDERKNRFIH